MSKSLHKVPYLSREVLIKSVNYKREMAKKPKNRIVKIPYYSLNLPKAFSGVLLNVKKSGVVRKKNKRQPWNEGISKSKFRRRKKKQKKKVVMGVCVFKELLNKK